MFPPSLFFSLSQSPLFLSPLQPSLSLLSPLLQAMTLAPGRAGLTDFWAQNIFLPSLLFSCPWWQPLSLHPASYLSLQELLKWHFIPEIGSPRPLERDPRLRNPIEQGSYWPFHYSAVILGPQLHVRCREPKSMTCSLHLFTVSREMKKE